jgi:hypothetical protein
LVAHNDFTSVPGERSLKICSTLILIESLAKPASRKTAQSGLRAAMILTSSSLMPVSKEAASALSSTKKTSYLRSADRLAV